jgi:hypothetical protein
MINKISVELTQENEDNVLQNLQGANDLLPFLIELSREERIKIPKLGRRRVDFMDRGLRYAKTNPRFVPPYLDVTEFEKDVTLRDQLYRIHDLSKKLTKKLRDSILIVESEAYEAARTFYLAAKDAAQKGEEGAEVIAKDLYFHYKKTRLNGDEKAEEQPVNLSEPPSANAA